MVAENDVSSILLIGLLVRKWHNFLQVNLAVFPGDDERPRLGTKDFAGDWERDGLRMRSVWDRPAYRTSHALYLSKDIANCFWFQVLLYKNNIFLMRIIIRS